MGVEERQGPVGVEGLQPEGGFGDLQGEVVEVHAVEVVTEDLAVEVEEFGMAAQFREAGVGDLVKRVELVERLDEERAAAAREVEDAEALEHLLPGLPEPDERLALRFVQRGEVVGIRVGQHAARRARRFRLVSESQFLEADTQDPAQRLLDIVAGDECRGVKRALLFPAGFCKSLVGRHAAGFEILPKAFEVGDRLLEDVAEDVHVDDRADFGGLGRIRDFAGRAVIVFAEVAEKCADIVRDTQRVEDGIRREQAAVVGGDFQLGVAGIDRPEKAPEVFPDRLGVVGVAVGERAPHRVGREQAAVLAERAEEHAVEQPLRAAEDFPRGDGRIFGAQADENLLPDVRVERVKFVRQLASDGFGFAAQVVEVAVAGLRDDAGRAEEEDKASEQRGLSRQARGLEALVGLLVRPLVVEPGLAHRGDDDPVAREVDRVAVGLIDRRHPPPGKRAVQRIARPLAFERDDKHFFIRSEPPEHGIRKLSVHLDMGFARQGEGVARACGPGIAEQAAKDVCEELRQQRGLLEGVRAPGADEIRPVPQPRIINQPRHRERQHVPTDHLRMKKRFGFDGHAVRSRLHGGNWNPSASS